MTTLESWLDDYAESHRNPTNKRIHRIAVPVIVFTLLGTLWAIPVPVLGNAAILGSIAAVAYYWRLSPTLALGIAALFLVSFVALGALATTLGAALVPTMIVVFAAAWVAQFYGHEVEGARPSFFKDLQFLLIGPLWLLADAYRRLGWSV